MHVARSGSHKLREEIGHVRELISENQKALSCIVRVLTQIQDHIRLLNDNLQQWILWQQRPGAAGGASGLAGGQGSKLIVEHQTRERKTTTTTTTSPVAPAAVAAVAEGGSGGGLLYLYPFFYFFFIFTIYLPKFT